MIEVHGNTVRSCPNRGLPARAIWRWTPVPLFIVSMACGSPNADPPRAPSASTPIVVAPNPAPTRPAAGVGAPAPTGVAGSPAPVVATGPWPAAGPTCGELGRDCAAAPCGPSSVCDNGIGICLPPRPAAMTVACILGSCSAPAAYCIAGQCMTETQAVCVCGGPVGSMRINACKSPPSASKSLPDVCFDEGSLCAAAPEKCCAGTMCVQSPNVLSQCFKPCTSAADCNGKCCSDRGAGVKVCDPTETC